MCGSDRWRPSQATHQTEGHGRTDIFANVESQAEKSSEQAEEAERPEEELNAMQTEGEEDPLAGLGMDEAEESLPSAPVKAGGHAEATTITGLAQGPAVKWSRRNS